GLTNIVFANFGSYGYNSVLAFSLGVDQTLKAGRILREGAIAKPSAMIAFGDSDLLYVDPIKQIAGTTDLQYIPMKARLTRPTFAAESKAVAERHAGKHV